MTACKPVLVGVGMTIVGMPGAVPYLAAIDLVLRNDLAISQQVGVLVFYNIVFIAPLAAVVVVRSALGECSQGLLDSIKGFFDTWGQRVIAGLMGALGIVLIADAIGWFLGMPLIPV